MTNAAIHTGFSVLTRRSVESAQNRLSDGVEYGRPLRGVTFAGTLWRKEGAGTARTAEPATESGSVPMPQRASRWSQIISDRRTRRTILSLAAVTLILSAASIAVAIGGGSTGAALVLLWFAGLAGIVLASFITHRLLMTSILYRAGKTYDRAVEAFESRLRLLE